LNRIDVRLIQLDAAMIQSLLEGARNVVASSIQASSQGSAILRRSDQPNPTIGFHVVEEAMPPEFVLEFAIAGLREGEDPYWWEPRGILLVNPTENRLEMVGTCGFKSSPRSDEVEIGYGVATPFQGQGVATAAVAHLVIEAFACPSLRRVTALTSVGNGASSRVLEKNHFHPIGSSRSTEDGWVQHWERTRA
jgi:[ribosomal protein S5]-alanine N-acetyltransferase